MLPRSIGIPGLGARIYPVKEWRFGFEIESETLKMLIPVGIFHNHLNLRINSLCRANDKALRSLRHLLQPEIGPAHFTLVPYAQFALAVGEEEIIENDLVKVPCSEFNYLLHLPAMFRIGIAVGLKPVHLTHCQCNAACRFDSSAVKELLNLLKRLLINDYHVTVRLEIDLVDMNLT